MRLGAVHSLDVTDVDVNERRRTVVLRPYQGTELKNGTNGERPVAITPDLAQLLGDYNHEVRKPMTDEYDREPLFDTPAGRMVRTTIRSVVYRTTAPCFRNIPCGGCNGTKDKECIDAVSPHAIRRGYITHFLTEDVPIEIVGDRMDVSRKVLNKQYDKRSEEVKLEQRRVYLDNI